MNSRPLIFSLCALNFLACRSNLSPPAAATRRAWIVFANACAFLSRTVAASTVAITLSPIFPRSRSCFPELLRTYCGCAMPTLCAKRSRNSSKFSVTPTTSIESKVFSNRAQSSSVTLAWHSSPWYTCSPTRLSSLPLITVRPGFEPPTSGFVSDVSTHSTSYPGCRICPVHLSPSSSRVCMSCTRAAHSAMSTPHAAVPGTSGHFLFKCSGFISSVCTLRM